jgi:hypothetical protein
VKKKKIDAKFGAEGKTPWVGLYRSIENVRTKKRATKIVNDPFYLAIIPKTNTLSYLYLEKACLDE